MPISSYFYAYNMSLLAYSIFAIFAVFLAGAYMVRRWEKKPLLITSVNTSTNIEIVTAVLLDERCIYIMFDDQE